MIQISVLPSYFYDYLADIDSDLENRGVPFWDAEDVLIASYKSFGIDADESNKTSNGEGDVVGQQQNSRSESEELMFAKYIRNLPVLCLG